MTTGLDRVSGTLAGRERVESTLRRPLEIALGGEPRRVMLS